ncbi:MAG: hypothetical protein HOP12_16385 [Candidatus Eisenbacteria bacterium]|uniref:RnfC Barrel sandwich hybrid domain-containing protein n=1 Tax=Eiseniibacteriota bacterium TaxID=2212470 RepID=A0A849SWJ2_UNCEI|nr:hypothetical protein [Candidatus Eisenbacteria bacterium]
MAHSYTPGLRVTSHAELIRERRLPLKGDVLVQAGDAVEARTVVARTDLPGNVQTVNLAAKLSLDPAKVPSALARPLGSAVRKGEIIAEAKGLFGLMSQKVEAPSDGTLESVSSITGQLIFREPPLPIEVEAYVRGVVDEVLPGEGVRIRTEGAFLQGIFGVGGETHGPVAMVSSGPEAELTADLLRPEHRDHVVVGGCYVSHATLMRARDLRVAAVVVGGFDDRDLRQLLGRDLGVAITGSETLGFTLILTEGFGRIAMAARSWNLLAAHVGELASVSGATQIRAGVMRPEIIIPRIGEMSAPAAEMGSGFELGAHIRVIRAPYFGRIGAVSALPPELHDLDSGTRVRVMHVRFTDDGSEALVPRANVELIER